LSDGTKIRVCRKCGEMIVWVINFVLKVLHFKFVLSQPAKFLFV
jgi:hypothetical protein